MPTVAFLGSTNDTNSGTHTVTATPQKGDVIVIITVASGNTSTATCTDDNSSGAYSLIASALKATSADIMTAQVRTVRIPAAVSTIFTHAPGTSTGGGLQVWAIRGLAEAGLAVILQNAKQENQAAATPAPVLGSVPKGGSAIIGAVFNATNPAGMAPRTRYTEDVDTGWSVPTSGVEAMHLESGETSATITWGNASASAFCSIAIEVAAPSITFNNYMAPDASSSNAGVISVAEKIR